MNKILPIRLVIAIPHIFPNIQYRILKIVQHALAKFLSDDVIIGIMNYGY